MAVLFLAALTTAGHAATVINQLPNGQKAIDGYDPVAYFTMHKATPGSEEFTYEWLGAKWYFVNAEHRDKFRAEPMRYAPQYGGYCAAGVSFGNTFNTDPEAWRIIDGRLYLINSKSLAKSWDQKTNTLIPRADNNWVGLRKTLTPPPNS